MSDINKEPDIISELIRLTNDYNNLYKLGLIGISHNIHVENELFGKIVNTIKSETGEVNNLTTSIIDGDYPIKLTLKIGEYNIFCIVGGSI